MIVHSKTDYLIEGECRAHFSSAGFDYFVYERLNYVDTFLQLSLASDVQSALQFPEQVNVSPDDQSVSFIEGDCKRDGRQRGGKAANVHSESHPTNGVQRQEHEQILVTPAES